MRRFRRIFCLYLSVAVLLGIAVAGFDADRFGVTDVISGTVAETADVHTQFLSEEPLSEGLTGEEESASAGEEISVEIPESTTEHYSAPATENSQEQSKEETQVWGEETTAEDELQPDIISFSEILGAKIQYHNTYKPSATNERVSELYFLSENMDALSSENAVNVYTFSADKRSVFSFKITHDAPAGAEGWQVSLYEEYSINGDGTDIAYRLISTLKTTVNTVDSSPEIGLSRGNYRLVVGKGNAFDARSYIINATLKEATDYEVECNDNIYRYTEIYSGVPLKGSASCFDDRQDDDYYLFRMYEDGFIDLKFEHGTVKDKISVCWQVLVFSEDGACMYSVNSLFTDEINKSGKIGLKAGNYYILIRNRVYTDMTYTLSVSRTDNSDYENEKNDTMDTADSISPGVTVTGILASQISGIDRDYFRFELSEPGFCAVEFAHEPAGDDADKNGWNIVLLDEKGRVLNRAISAWGDDVTVLPDTGLGKGIYYIRVDSESLYLNSDKYYLTLSLTPAVDWETELNDSPANADVIFMASPVTGLISDRGTDYDFDYYVIDLEENSDIKISLSHERLSYSKEIFNFTLLDGDNNTVNSYVGEGTGAAVIKSMSDSTGASALYKGLEAGKYYIRVSSGIFFDTISYTLEYGKGE